MYKLRLHFSKTGAARFISHLDLIQVLKRGMLRAGMPLRYSEGYNPHAVMSIALPLPVGVEGLYEAVDFDFLHPVAPDSLPEKLSAALPPGIAVLDAAPPVRQAREIAKARYDISFQGAAEHIASLRGIFDSRPLVVEKRSKKGRSDIDIAPLTEVERIYVSGGGVLHLQVVLPSANPSLSPEHVLSAVAAESCITHAGLAARMAILCGDGTIF